MIPPPAALRTVPDAEIPAVLARFHLPGPVTAVIPLGSGHIHATFIVTVEAPPGPKRFLLQRLNAHVFRDADGMTRLIARLSRHLEKKTALEGKGGFAGQGSLAGQGRLAEQGPAPLLRLVPCRSPTGGLGLSAPGPDLPPEIVPGSLKATDPNLLRENAPDYTVRDAQGRPWRLFHFIEGGRSFDLFPSPAHAFAAARGFGEFLARLQDFSEKEPFFSIPDFHAVDRRFERFKAVERMAQESGKAERATEKAEEGEAGKTERAAGLNPGQATLNAGQAAGRFHLGTPERARIHAFADLIGEAGRLRSLLPLRYVHNDAKCSNILFDAEGRCLAVVDWDTVMPGLAVHDFGDLVRSGAVTVAEDSPDWEKADVDLERFRALAAGFVAGAGDTLTRPEREHLVLGALHIAVEQGIRFLTDYLEGDLYYPVHYPDHNLVRARTQLALAQRLREKRARLEEIVAGLA